MMLPPQMMQQLLAQRYPMAQVGNAAAGPMGMQMPGMPNDPRSLLARVGDARVGNLGLGQPQPNMDFRKSMIGMGMNMLNNRNTPGGMPMLQNLPMIMQMLKGRR